MDAGGRAPTVGALGDAGAIAEDTKFFVLVFLRELRVFVVNTNP
jgi:hypothetical protein